jgi:hypothetical protein
MNITQIFIGTFVFLLRLYPVRFREEFEKEMTDVFIERSVERASDGTEILVLSCLQEYWDLAFNLFKEYMAEIRKEKEMEKALCGRFHLNPIWWGGIIFGFSEGLTKLLTYVPAVNNQWC